MIAFIVNSISAGGLGKKVWPKLELTLKMKDVPYSVHFTQRPKHAVELTKTVLKDMEVEAVVAVGGDGTVHEIAQELVRTDCPLGFIPCGSGNDLARALNIPTNPVKALERILAKQTRKIDIARINDHVFVNGTGIGFDATVAKVSNESSGKQWLNRVKLGRFVYLGNALKLLSTFRPTHMVITIDGEKLQFANVWLMAICNIPYYAGGMKICPDAVPNDGFLDVCIVNDMSRIDLLRNLVKVFNGTHIAARGVTMVRGQTITVQPVATQYVHTDGESYLTSPVKITAYKQKLRIL